MSVVWLSVIHNCKSTINTIYQVTVLANVVNSILFICDSWIEEIKRGHYKTQNITRRMAIANKTCVSGKN